MELALRSAQQRVRRKRREETEQKAKVEECRESSRRVDRLPKERRSKEMNWSEGVASLVGVRKKMLRLVGCHITTTATLTNSFASSRTSAFGTRESSANIIPC